MRVDVMEKNMYYIKKSFRGGGVYYLSPLMSRWIPEDSKKHRFGKFSKENAETFIEYKKQDNKPDGIEYHLIPVES